MSTDSATPGSTDLDRLLSIQLYSLRALGNLDAELDAAAGAGFRLVEAIGSQLATPQVLKAALAARALRAPSGHVGMQELREQLPRIAAAAQEVGIGQLYMPALPPAERGGGAQDWQRVGAELGHMADALAAHGIGLGYHNHDWELEVRDDGRTALENLFDGAGGSPLTWQADVAWLARGGSDPVGWLERYAAIVTSVHVKDIAPSGMSLDEDGWSDVGAGILDWAALWSAARQHGADLLVVEHDNPRDPIGFAARSHAYLVGLDRSMLPGLPR